MPAAAFVVWLAVVRLAGPYSVAEDVLRSGSGVSRLSDAVTGGVRAVKLPTDVFRQRRCQDEQEPGVPKVEQFGRRSPAWTLTQHVASGKITQAAANAAKRVAVAGTRRIDLRIAEQKMIQSCGGLKNLANKINSIAPKYWSGHGIY